MFSVITGNGDGAIRSLDFKFGVNDIDMGDRHSEKSLPRGRLSGVFGNPNMLSDVISCSSNS